MSWIIWSYSRSEPSHQWTRSGWQRARTCSTQRSRAWFLVVGVISMCLPGAPRANAAGPARTIPHSRGRPKREEGNSILHSSAERFLTVSHELFAPPGGRTFGSALPARRGLALALEPVEHTPPPLFRR